MVYPRRRVIRSFVADALRARNNSAFRCLHKRENYYAARVVSGSGLPPATSRGRINFLRERNNTNCFALTPHSIRNGCNKM